jgi:hypothetical protein
MIRNLLVITGFFIVLFSSCYSSRKAKINEAIQSTTEQQQKELETLKAIENSKTSKLEDGKIDSAINKKITASIKDSRDRIDSVKKMMDEMTAATANRKTLRKSYHKIIKSKLVYLQDGKASFQKRQVNYGMITDVLDNSKQAQFDLASFFGPGEFLIPADKVGQATDAFMPIVDSMLKFAAKYPDLSKSTTVVLKGYADATGISPGSPLYYRLANELKQNSPGNSELNLALSKLRTESISEIVNKIIQKRQPDFKQQKIINIELIQEGRGEEKPNPKIQDYTAEDTRRRIVLFFWSLMPI